MEKTTVMAEFSIIGDDFVPQNITNQLKITPEKYWIKGDVIKGKNIKRRETCWTISTGYEESFDISQQLYKVVNLLTKKKNMLNQLKDQYKLEYLFSVVVKIENNEKPAMYFERDFIEFVNELEAEIDIDLYIYS